MSRNANRIPGINMALRAQAGGRGRGRNNRGRARLLGNTLQGARYSTGSSGHLVVSHEELFFAPTVAKSGDAVVAKSFLPGMSGMPMLDAIGKIYDRYRITSLRFHWKTSASMTTTGALILGVDGDVTNTGGTLAYAQALVPKYRGPVWQEGTVSIRAQDLMTKRWLSTATKDKLKDPAYAACAAVLGIANAQMNVIYGEVWCTYSVEFSSPTGGSGNS
jgi:hypothetical protein